MFARENKGNMMTENEILEKYNEVLMTHYNELVQIDNYGYFRFNENWLFHLLYGNDATMNAYLGLLDGELAFIDGSKYIEKGLKKLKDYCLYHTVNKLGCNASPIYGLHLKFFDGAILCIRKVRGDCDFSEYSDYGIGIDYVNVIYSKSLSKERLKEIEEFVISNMVKVNKPTKIENEIPYLFAFNGASDRIELMKLKFKKMNINLKANYNDDLPYDKITELLHSKKSELILLNGLPGTGKTTLIKHMLSETERENLGKIIMFDYNLLSNISFSGLINFLLNQKGSIIVLEDCDKLLSKRESGNNFMSTLLNMTDGIIGESLNIKFLCTFNSKDTQIDPALMRKGRLSLHYTFGKLCLDKTKSLCPNATSPMTLSEIYYNGTENNFSTRETRRIGF